MMILNGGTRLNSSDLAQKRPGIKREIIIVFFHHEILMRHPQAAHQYFCSMMRRHLICYFQLFSLPKAPIKDWILRRSVQY
jgi:hypothetical protein